MWQQPTADPGQPDELDDAMEQETRRVGTLTGNNPQRPHRERDADAVRLMWATAATFTPKQRAAAITMLSTPALRRLGVRRVVRMVASW